MIIRIENVLLVIRKVGCISWRDWGRGRGRVGGGIILMLGRGDNIRCFS